MHPNWLRSIDKLGNTVQSLSASNRDWIIQSTKTQDLCEVHDHDRTSLERIPIHSLKAIKPNDFTVTKWAIKIKF